jgi:hypothetical protein
VGDDDVQITVIVIISKSEAAAVVGLGKRWVQRGEVVKELTEPIPEKKTFLRLQQFGFWISDFGFHS